MPCSITSSIIADNILWVVFKNLRIGFIKNTFFQKNYDCISTNVIRIPGIMAHVWNFSTKAAEARGVP